MSCTEQSWKTRKALAAGLIDKWSKLPCAFSCIILTCNSHTEARFFKIKMIPSHSWVISEENVKMLFKHACLTRLPGQGPLPWIARMCTTSSQDDDIPESARLLITIASSSLKSCQEDQTIVKHERPLKCMILNYWNHSAWSETNVPVFHCLDCKSPWL